jgi:prolipoprotein diacylglyceryltransferase
VYFLVLFCIYSLFLIRHKIKLFNATIIYDLFYATFDLCAQYKRKGDLEIITCQNMQSTGNHRPTLLIASRPTPT